MNETFKDKSIYDVINEFKDKKRCGLRFIFDENEWDEKTDDFAPVYNDVTNTYFEGINNE